MGQYGTSRALQEAYRRDPHADLPRLGATIHAALLRAAPVLFPAPLDEPAVEDLLEPYMPRWPLPPRVCTTRPSIRASDARGA